MPMATYRGLVGAMALAAVLAGCGDGLSFGGTGPIGDVDSAGVDDAVLRQRAATPLPYLEQRETVFDLFTGRGDPNVNVSVNRYIWNATLDVLDFMPVEVADPFTGVINFGYGAPPGSGRAYRATVQIRDPALEARSLTVALQTRNGPASAETVRAVEDAILTRARQLRIRDGEL